jgi:Ca2+-binding EF-hand superfamily protein
MKTFTTILATLALSTAFALAADEKPATGAKGGEGKKRDPEEAFKKLDTNKDGSVSLEEFKAGPMGKRNPDKVDEFFKKRDKDASGSLSLEEFKAERPKKNKE